MPLITAITPCYPTEDREKVRQALLNIFPGAEIEEGASMLTARTENADRLREIIIDNHIRDSARSVMLRGIRDGSTRFVLNKQVAFVGKVSFLDDTVALGGIEVTVEDKDIEKTIDILAESTVEAKEVIAVSSPAFSALEFSEALESVANNFQAWEVVAEGRHDLREIEKQFLELTPSYELEFSAHAPMSDINIGSLNPRMREAAMRELLGGLGACRRLGMDVYTVHPAFLTPLGFVSPDKVKEVTKSALRKLDSFSQELGVRVALENMPRSPFSMATTPDALLELIDGTELGICLDVGHANTMGKLKDFVKLKKGIINLHVHDNKGETDEHLPIGSGNVDFPWLLKSLSSYKGRYIIESRGMEDALVSRDRLTALLSHI